MKHFRGLSVVLAALTVLCGAQCLRAQETTAFTYQGRLNNSGSPVGGSYDLTFTIYDSTNIPGNVIAGPITNSATLVSNGLFTTTLDFGSNVFNGNAAWLEIGVRTNGNAAFATLSPRQQLTPTPYAMFANTASNLSGTVSASQLSGTIPSAQLPSSIITNGASGINISGTFTGDGSSLTNVSGPATTLYSYGTSQTISSTGGYPSVQAIPGFTTTIVQTKTFAYYLVQYNAEAYNSSSTPEYIEIVPVVNGTSRQGGIFTSLPSLPSYGYYALSGSFVVYSSPGTNTFSFNFSTTSSSVSLISPVSTCYSFSMIIVRIQ